MGSPGAGPGSDAGGRPPPLGSSVLAEAFAGVQSPILIYLPGVQKEFWDAGVMGGISTPPQAQLPPS